MVARKLEWMPFYGDRFWQDERVAALGDRLELVYLRLLWRSWRDGGIEEASVAGVARLIDATEAEVRELLELFFELGKDAIWRNRVLEDERRRRDLTSRKRAAAGRASVRVRREKHGSAQPKKATKPAESNDLEQPPNTVFEQVFAENKKKKYTHTHTHASVLRGGTRRLAAEGVRGRAAATDPRAEPAEPEPPPRACVRAGPGLVWAGSVRIPRPKPRARPPCGERQVRAAVEAKRRRRTLSVEGLREAAAAAERLEDNLGWLLGLGGAA